MKIAAVPLSDAEFANLSGQPITARGGMPSGRPSYTVGRAAGLPKNFWWVWSASAVPLIAGVLVSLTGVSDLATASLLFFGSAIVLTNIVLALCTNGYSTGDLVGVGTAFALVTGWVGVIVIALAVIAAVVIVAIFLLVLAAIGAAASNK